MAFNLAATVFTCKHRIGNNRIDQAETVKPETGVIAIGRPRRGQGFISAVPADLPTMLTMSTGSTEYKHAGEL